MKTAAGFYLKGQLDAVRGHGVTKINIKDSSGSETGWLAITPEKRARIQEILMEDA